MMIISVSLLFMMLKCAFCKTSITTYPTVDLLENSPLNTLVVSFSRLTNVTSARKLVLLNLNGFESNLFSIVNGSIHTIKWIDREEFVAKQYCLDDLYCKIELHILVNDGNEYWIIPIHIVDENDNEPEFRVQEIELKFRENVVNGYQIPFEGARDMDEGKNGEIEYLLDCSNDFDEKIFISNITQTSRNCFRLFELIILSRSLSSSTYDRLALKFLPSVHIEDEYKLKVYAIDKKKKKKTMLNVKIKIEQKEKEAKFSLSQYEFVVLLNSSFLSRNEDSRIKIGRVYAIPTNPSERIYYQLIRKTNNEIEINSLTGELDFLLHSNSFQFSKKKTEMEFDVQASILRRNSSKMLITKSRVKIFLRHLIHLNNISFEYQINSLKQQQNEIIQINNSNSFFIDKNMEINEELFQIILHSSFYPFDQFILSLHNYLNIFSLISSLTNPNSFILKPKQHLQSTSVYLLNIGIKHKLSQQWLSDLRLELIVVDQWTTTTIRNQMTTNQNEIGFCERNQSYILYHLKRKKKRIGLLKVMKSSSLSKSTDMKLNLFVSINGSEMIVNDGCRMVFDEINNYLLNRSFQYQLCLLSHSNQCYNLTIANEIMLRKSSNHTIDDNHGEKRVLSMKIVEMIMLIVSLMFIFITIILIGLICRLKEMKICLRLKNCWIYRNRYGLTNVQQQFSSSSFKIKERVHSIVNAESPSSSFQSIQIKNDRFICHIDDYDQEEEALPSANMFVLSSSIRQSSLSPSSLSSSLIYSQQQQQQQPETLLTSHLDLNTIPQRTSSSSSFLQETKQLLDMISTNQPLDPSKLVSEV